MTKFKEKIKTIRKPTKDIVVLYHNDCTDGFSSAWVAWKKIGDKADYIGINPGTAPVGGLKNKEIYMVDLIYPIQYLNKLIVANKKLVAIDHHVSNKKSFELVKNGLFSINHSGAVLAWKYFNPKIKTPKLLKHVEDMDLWKFKLSKTKEIFSYLDMFDFDFKIWNKLVKDFENPSKHKEYAKQGKLILNYEDKLIERLVANFAEPVNLLGYKTYVVNSPNFHSQIGNLLTKKYPPIGIVWREENNGGIHVSLRSNGTVDVSKIAAQFGGGGHKAAAGFYVENYSKLPWKKIRSDN